MSTGNKPLTPSDLKRINVDPQHGLIGQSSTGGDGYSKMADTVLPISSEGNFIDLTSYAKLVDGKIAKFFYEGGRHIKDHLKNNTFVKVSSEDKLTYLVAVKNIKTHTANVTSHKMCLAACSEYILDGFFFDKKDQTLSVDILKPDPIPMMNVLAEAHGFEDKSKVYYWVYTIGLEFMAQRFPELVIPMLIWRTTYRYHIFTKKPDGSSEDDNASDFTQCVVYIEKAATKEGKGVKEYLDAMAPRFKTHLDYLSRIVPGAGSRHARAVVVYDALQGSQTYLISQIKINNPSVVIKQSRA